MILRTALVTGAGRGYGLELCRGLAARGAHVFGTVRDDEGAAAFAEATGGSGTAILADVTDEAAGAAIAAALAARDQPLDLLVNNAGVMTTGARIEEVRIADVDHLLRVHVHGPIRCTQAALPWLRRSPTARSSTSPAAWARSRASPAAPTTTCGSPTPCGSARRRRTC